MNTRDFFKQLASGLLVAAAPTIFIPKLIQPQWRSIYPVHQGILMIYNNPGEPKFKRNFNLPLTRGNIAEIKRNMFNPEPLIEEVKTACPGECTHIVHMKPASEWFIYE